MLWAQTHDLAQHALTLECHSVLYYSKIPTPRGRLSQRVPWSLVRGDEELGAVGVPSAVGHRDHETVVFENEVLVLEEVPIDAEKRNRALYHHSNMNHIYEVNLFPPVPSCLVMSPPSIMRSGMRRWKELPSYPNPSSPVQRVLKEKHHFTQRLHFVCSIMAPISRPCAIVSTYLKFCAVFGVIS